MNSQETQLFLVGPSFYLTTTVCLFTPLHIELIVKRVVRFERIYAGKEKGVSAPGGKRETVTAGEGFVRCYEINQFRYFYITLTRFSLQLWISTPLLFAMTKIG